MYKKVDTGREGERVFLMEIAGNRRFFYWMQDRDSVKDEARGFAALRLFVAVLSAAIIALIEAVVVAVAEVAVVSTTVVAAGVQLVAAALLLVTVLIAGLLLVV